MRVSTSFFLPLLWCLSAAASAAIYRCDGDPPVFQDSPCGSTAISAAGSTPGAGVRDAEQAWLQQRARQRLAGRAAKATGRAAGRRGDDRQEQQCWKKRQRLDQVRARLRRGYKPAQGDRLRRQRKAYQDYLFRYCG